jgi:hypothetical protein
LPYADVIEKACSVSPTFSPLVAYCIAWRETIREYGTTAANRMSDNGDGGHGLFQETSSWPSNWMDPYTNALYAVQNFLLGAEIFWATKGFAGTDLVRCIAAEFNAGRGMWYAPNDPRNIGALGGHYDGNVDKFTAGGDYGIDVATQYLRLLAGLRPI